MSAVQRNHCGERRREAGLMVTSFISRDGGTGILKFCSQTCERSVQISQDTGKEMGDIQRVTRFEDDFACLQQIVVNMANTVRASPFKL